MEVEEEGEKCAILRTQLAIEERLIHHTSGISLVMEL